MNYQQRLNFYLGKKLSENNFNINDFTDKKKIIDYVIKNPYIKSYIEPFEKLLIKTQNLDKYFYLSTGDITHHTNIFSICKNRWHDFEDSVILRCLNFNRHWHFYYNKPLDNIAFKDKLDIVFWRGTTTGEPNRRANRFILVEKWFNKNNNIDIGFSFICQGKDNYINYVKEKVLITNFLQYKYLLSVEGNDKDSGLNWKLNSNCVVMMARPGVTSWLMETTLIPNYHYVLLNDDFSDLEEKLEWCNQNQDKCIEIIKNANDFMKQFADEALEEKLEEDVINKYFELTNS